MKQLPIFIILLFSCLSQNPSKIYGKSKINKLEVVKPKTIDRNSTTKSENQLTSIEEEYFDYSKTTLKYNINDSVSYKFSNIHSKDLFTFFVPKGNINDTKSILKVMDKDKNVVFELNFQTRELINGYALWEIKNDEEMVNYITKMAHQVLAKYSFVDFNNLDKESYLNDLSIEEFQNYNVLELIKLENRFVFVLRREEENIIYFGYDKNSNKVVEIYTCC